MATECEKEKKRNALDDSEKWCMKVGPEGMWIAVALAGSTGLKQSDFINEMTNVPPTAWRTLARHIAIRIMNRVRQSSGLAIMRIDEPMSVEFFRQPDITELCYEDVKYCIQFLSGFGVTKLKLPTTIERALHRIGEILPTINAMRLVKVAVIVSVVLVAIGVIAFFVLLSQLTP